MRPRWVYRETPMNEFDSGGRLIDILEHLGHYAAKWPELATLLADEREWSAWEWHADQGRYVEVAGWTGPI